VLPERGRALAAPLAGALEGFVREQVDTFFASDTFERLWQEANRRAHTRVVAVLEGDVGEVVDGLAVDGEQVRLDLVAVIDRVVAQVAEASPEVFGRAVDLSGLSGAGPDEAVARLEDALGRELPDDFGQFTVFEADRLQQVQDGVALAQRLVVLAVLASVLLVGAALAVSPHRRRTLVQLAAGVALGVVLVRRVGIRLEDHVVDMARPEDADAVRVVVGAFTSSLLAATAGVLAVAAAVLVVALVTGPYGWARSLRRLDGLRRPGALRHRDALRLGGVAVAVLVLLVADTSWLGLALLAVVFGAFQLALWRPAPEAVEPPVGEGALSG
jgi:hypothetical protein